MFDTISGLPVHPLVVHAVVVLGPLVARCGEARAAPGFDPAQRAHLAGR